VTNYEKQGGCPNPPSAYWYSTGGCHPYGSDGPARPLAVAPGDGNIARCIAQPDKSTFKPGPATAEIVYGIDGVCHQICNRILAATAGASTKQVTVSKANGYRISRFVYGTHGTPTQWASLRDKCKVAYATTLSPDEELDQMVREAFGVQLAATKRTSLQNEREKLQADIHNMSGQVRAGSIGNKVFAERVNDRINETLDRLAKTMGKQDFERFFSWPAGQKIVLVNPQISAEMNYRQ
jgi:hypothetical protein